MHDMFAEMPEETKMDQWRRSLAPPEGWEPSPAYVQHQWRVLKDYDEYLQSIGKRGSLPRLELYDPNPDDTDLE